MVSYAIVYRHGLEKYVDDVCKRGVAGLIVPDLPVEESAQLAKICAARDVSLIQLVTPTTPRERAVRIAETSTGFLYYVSVAGITGERTEAAAGAGRQRRLAAHADRPADLHRLRHQHAGAREAARAGGRRPDRRLGDRAANRGRGRAAARRVLREVGDYVAELLAALYSHDCTISARNPSHRRFVLRRSNRPAYASGPAAAAAPTSKSIHFIARRNGSMRSITSPF